jgi:hypothetical protein
MNCSLKEAKKLVEGQLQALQPGGFKEIEASYSAMIALTEAELGDYGAARGYAASSATLSRSRTTLPLLAIAFAFGGESKNVKATIEELTRRYPSDTGVQSVYISRCTSCSRIDAERFGEGDHTTSPDKAL